jgi:hypothetical protein
MQQRLLRFTFADFGKHGPEFRLKPHACTTSLYDKVSMDETTD